MDRHYKPFDTVTVYPHIDQACDKQIPLAQFKGKAISSGGYDYHRYQGVLYPTYVSRQTGETVIFMDRPAREMGVAT